MAADRLAQCFEQARQEVGTQLTGITMTEVSGDSGLVDCAGHGGHGHSPVEAFPWFVGDRMRRERDHAVGGPRGGCEKSVKNEHDPRFNDFSDIHSSHEKTDP